MNAPVECPKCHYVRQEHDATVHAGVCPACGIAYAKWLAQQASEAAAIKQQADATAKAEAAREAQTTHATGKATDAGGESELDETQEVDEASPVWELFVEVPDEVDDVEFWGRAGVWCALLAWTIYFASHGVDWEIIGGSFLHNINLPFHEFGHVFFSPFGEFMHILGGSLFQVSFPFVLMFAFTLYQHENFGASVMLWWCGQNFVDVSPYIRDGLYRALPLVGGKGEESHDWGNLLRIMGVEEKAPHYGNISFGIGCAIMCAGLAWGAFILYRQYQVKG
jgi:predicted  nucleic acid-binding Zn-ribbon protein